MFIYQITGQLGRQAIGKLVRMEPSSAHSFHDSSQLEMALIELARAGMKGNPSSVRKLANKLIRCVPEDVTSPELFRAALHDAMSVSRGDQVSFSSQSLPMESGGAGPLVVVDETPDGSNLVLPQSVQLELDEIVLERQHQRRLAMRGLGPSHSALFSGAPGVGKTLASQWVAQRLGLPLVSLDLAAVLSSYLGTSGRNVRAVLDFAKTTPCVLLLDEFDALAKARDDDSDVGELKRIVNVLLVELDRWDNRSFLIAATNHIQLLDPAIGRRFDRIINFPLPGNTERAALISAFSSDQLEPTLVQAMATITEGCSPSDLTRLLDRAARRSVLHDIPYERVLLTELLSRPMITGPARDAIWQRLHRRFGLSMRTIADLAGVSHPTVSNAVRRIEKSGGANG